MRAAAARAAGQRHHVGRARQPAYLELSRELRYHVPASCLGRELNGPREGRLNQTRLPRVRVRRIR